ncbi:MAG: hypothetical protein J7M40_03540, partial [Planctomycetes bacterium]|nr:hypothetical protein [Planctomycetota bacterium]
KENQRRYFKGLEDHREYARQADKIWSGEVSQRLALLADSVKADSKSMVVYNALPWKRSGLVDVPGQKGKQIFVKDIPASGYKVVSIKESDESVADGENTLETPFYKVVFDLERGGISSLINKRTGKEIVDTNSEFVLGQFLHERFSADNVMDYVNSYTRKEAGYGEAAWGKPGMPKDVKYAKTVPSDWEITTSKSKSSDVVTLTAGDTKGLAKAYQMRFTFPRNEPFVEVEWTVDTTTPTRIPEGGWLCFPFALEYPKFTVGRPGGPIDPAKDIIDGSNRHMMAVMSGVSVESTDGTGMGVCPLDSPLISMGEPGLWKFTYDYVPTKPAVFVNLYNNEWNTNFPLWIEGSWSERVRVWPIGNKDVVEDLTVNSWNARMPLLAAQATGKKAKLPKSRQGLSLSRKGVLVTAFGKDPYGAEGTLLRVWEQTGKSGKITVKLPKGVKVTKATPVNLRGEITGKAIKVSGGKLKFELGAYAPTSFVLE